MPLPASSLLHPRRVVPNGIPSAASESIQALWTAALHDYQQSLGVDLQDASLSLVNDLQFCSSGEEILERLQNMTQCLSDKRDGGTVPRALRKAIEPIVRGLSVILDATAESASSLGMPGGKGIFVAVAVLLKAADNVGVTYDDFEKLFERLGAYVKRLEARLHVPMKSGTREIAVRALVEILKALVLATKMLRKNRVQLFLKALFTPFNGVRSAIQDIEAVVSDEERMAVTDVVVGMHEISSQLSDNAKTLSDLAVMSSATSDTTHIILDEVRENERKRAMDNQIILEMLRKIVDQTKTISEQTPSHGSTPTLPQGPFIKRRRRTITIYWCPKV